MGICNKLVQIGTENRLFVIKCTWLYRFMIWWMPFLLNASRVSVRSVNLGNRCRPLSTSLSSLCNSSCQVLYMRRGELLVTTGNWALLTNMLSMKRRRLWHGPITKRRTGIFHIHLNSLWRKKHNRMSDEDFIVRGEDDILEGCGLFSGIEATMHVSFPSLFWCSFTQYCTTSSNNKNQRSITSTMN